MTDQRQLSSCLLDFPNKRQMYLKEHMYLKKNRYKSNHTHLFETSVLEPGHWNAQIRGDLKRVGLPRHGPSSCPSHIFIFTLSQPQCLSYSDFLLQLLEFLHGIYFYFLLGTEQVGQQFQFAQDGHIFVLESPTKLHSPRHTRAGSLSQRSVFLHISSCFPLSIPLGGHFMICKQSRHVLHNMLATSYV